MKTVSSISCFSSYVPSKIVTNDDLSKMVDTNDEWIRTRTGIEERRIAEDNETTADMSIKATQRLVNENNINVEEINLIIVATTTNDKAFPSVACAVQNALNMKNAYCFDVSAACSGFLYGLSIADKFIRCNEAKKAIVIGVDKMSSIVNWKDRNTCVLFGDGAGIAMLEAQEEKEEGQSKIIDIQLYSDGKIKDILETENVDGRKEVRMNGQEVFRQAVLRMSESTKQMLEKHNMSINDIDKIVPHQANKRIMDGISKQLGADKSKTIINIEKYGNTSAASIPIAFHQAIQEGKIKKKDKIIIQCLGAGITWGCGLIIL